MLLRLSLGPWISILLHLSVTRMSNRLIRHKQFDYLLSRLWNVHLFHTDDLVTFFAIYTVSLVQSMHMFFGWLVGWLVGWSINMSVRFLRKLRSHVIHFLELRTKDLLNFSTSIYFKKLFKALKARENKRQNSSTKCQSVEFVPELRDKFRRHGYVSKRAFSMMGLK